MRVCVLVVCCLALAAAAVSANEASAEGADQYGITWVTKNGPVAGGVDIWEAGNDHFVANSFMGIALGNVKKGTKIAVERYRHAQKTKKDFEKATFGYGYVKSGTSFAGWHGADSCGWFPLQRVIPGLSHPVIQNSKRQNHVAGKHRCGTPAKGDTDGPLGFKRLFKAGTYITGTGVGSTVNAISITDCPTYINYNPHTNKVGEAGPVIPKGTWGAGKIGTLDPKYPKVKRCQIFGTRYETKNGRMTMIKYPDLIAGSDMGWFFVPSTCISWDKKAAQNATKPRKGDKKSKSKSKSKKSKAAGGKKKAGGNKAHKKAKKHF